MTSPFPPIDTKKMEALVTSMTQAHHDAMERDIFFFALLRLDPQQKEAYATGWVAGWLAAHMNELPAREHPHPKPPEPDRMVG
jgi:hypothetical protein